MHGPYFAPNVIYLKTLIIRSSVKIEKLKNTLGQYKAFFVQNQLVKVVQNAFNRSIYNVGLNSSNKNKKLTKIGEGQKTLISTFEKLLQILPKFACPMSTKLYSIYKSFAQYFLISEELTFGLLQLT